MDTSKSRIVATHGENFAKIFRHNREWWAKIVRGDEVTDRGPFRTPREAERAALRFRLDIPNR